MVSAGSAACSGLGRRSAAGVRRTGAVGRRVSGNVAVLVVAAALVRCGDPVPS